MLDVGRWTLDLAVYVRVGWVGGWSWWLWWLWWLRVGVGVGVVVGGYLGRRKKDGR